MPVMPVIGFVGAALARGLSSGSSAFWKALNDIGFVEGQNPAIGLSLGRY